MAVSDMDTRYGCPPISSDKKSPATLLAVMFPDESFLGYSWLDPQQTPVSNTFAIRLKPDQTRPLVFRFYAVWQPSSEQFGTPDGFGKLLRRDALLKAWPLVVTLGR